jgi:tetratricopeptide (TPR) repeat protein
MTMESGRTLDVSSRPSPSGAMRFLLTGLVMVYGAVAGLRTVADFDLGWQMAEARSPLSSHDILSYTALGAAWIYPPLAGMVFRWLMQVGGYAAISWFCAAALLVTLAIVAWRSRTATLLLLLIAVPTLASQMIPRSGLFTVVIAAAYTRLLLSHYLEQDTPGLWPLPLLMIFWVNLHTGFIAGLGLMLGYILLEIADCFSVSRREGAQRRLKQAVPWVAASVTCTLLNPWGFRIYGAIVAQEHISKVQAGLIEELTPLYREFFWRGMHPLAPLNAVWWILAVSAVAVILLVRQKRIGLALFLAVAICVCLSSARTLGVFLPIACIAGGDALQKEAGVLRPLQRFAWWPTARWMAAIAVVLAVAWRCAGVVTDRTSLQEGQITLFGAGASWWLPAEAAAFVERNQLPAEVFSTFNLSSYLTWRLGPRYRDFADGRYLPFGDRIVSEQLRLTSLPIDSEDWQRAANTYNIRTIIFPLARLFGIEGVPLREDCQSRIWVPVYFDAKAIVFVRKDAWPESRLAALRVDCQRQQLILDGDARSNRRSRIEHYQMLGNAATIYFLLGRNEDAENALQKAFQISEDDDSLVLLRGQLQAAQGKTAAAEQSFRRALQMHASDAAWFQLGLLCAQQRRYPEAIDALRNAIQLAPGRSFLMEWMLAKVEVLAGEEQAALRTLKDAWSTIPGSGPEGAEARANVHDVEAAAYSQLANWPSAIAAEQSAIEETPTAARRWQLLAEMYAGAGEQDQALRAKERADELAGQHP